MTAAPATVAPGRAQAARARLEEVDKRDAALMSIGTLASGVLAYVFNVVAARSLGPEAFGGVGALWAGMFLLAVLLFRPVEQTLSRAIADQTARDADARAAVRSTARLAALIAVGSVAACLAAWGPLTDGLFNGEGVLTAALAVGLAGYAASYFARGLAGGVRWYGGYGLVLLADGGIRLLIALPLLFIASTTVAAIAIAAAAGGGAVALLASKDRVKLHRMRGHGGDPAPFSIREAARFALPAGVIGGCEQILVSGGPLLVLIAGGPEAASAAGVLFAATLMVRAPVFVMQGIQASLLPNLTTFQAQGDHARLHRATARVALVLTGFSALVALGCLAVGPEAMGLMYGDGFDATRIDLALMGLGIGGFLAAGTFCQALLARGEGGRAAACWSAAAAVFVGLELALGGSDFHRVSVAFAAASTLIAVLLMAAVWRQRA